ncbi:hypothetical protein P4234_00115 [Pseudomonas aeruginosa]|nr:hypothetical protein [Pseudomonas aeruginosa]
MRAQSRGVEYGEQTDSQTVAPVTLDLLPGVAEPILPGSLVFTWAGEVYVDRSGVLYKNINSSTNAGIAVGSVDYAGRTATLNTYGSGGGADGHAAGLSDHQRRLQRHQHDLPHAGGAAAFCEPAGDGGSPGYRADRDHHGGRER